MPPFGFLGVGTGKNWDGIGSGGWGTTASMFRGGQAIFRGGPAKFGDGPAKFRGGPAMFRDGPAMFRSCPAMFSRVVKIVLDRCHL